MKAMPRVFLVPLLAGLALAVYGLATANAEERLTIAVYLGAAALATSIVVGVMRGNRQPPPRGSTVAWLTGIVLLTAVMMLLGADSPSYAAAGLIWMAAGLGAGVRARASAH